MNQFYYTCPIIAAYMAKHFSMSYSSHIQKPKHHQWDTAAMFVNRNGNWANDWFYIDPDSIGILSPRLCDKDADGFTYEQASPNIGGWVRIDKHSNEFKSPQNSHTAFRNGMPFFQPESE